MCVHKVSYINFAPFKSWLRYRLAVHQNSKVIHSCFELVGVYNLLSRAQDVKRKKDYEESPN